MRNLLAKQPTIRQPVYLANPVFHPPISILHPFLSLGVSSSHPTPEPASGTAVASATADPLPRLVRFVRITASILTSVGWAMVFVRERSRKRLKKEKKKKKGKGKEERKKKKTKEEKHGKCLPRMPAGSVAHWPFFYDRLIPLFYTQMARSFDNAMLKPHQVINRNFLCHD